MTIPIFRDKNLSTGDETKNEFGKTSSPFYWTNKICPLFLFFDDPIPQSPALHPANGK